MGATIFIVGGKVINVSIYSCATAADKLTPNNNIFDVYERSSGDDLNKLVKVK